MKRILKNVIMILIIIAVGIGSYFTMKDVNNGAQPSKMENQEMSQDGQNEPPAKPEENGENTSVTSLEDDDNSYSNINLNGYKLYVNGTAITK